VVPGSVRHAQELRGQDRALQVPPADPQKAAVQDLHRGAPCDDLLRAGHPVCGAGGAVGRGLHHSQRQLGDIDWTGAFQVQHRLRKKRPGADLSGRRSLRGPGKSRGNLLLTKNTRTPSGCFFIVTGDRPRRKWPRPRAPDGSRCIARTTR